MILLLGILIFSLQGTSRKTLKILLDDRRPNGQQFKGGIELRLTCQLLYNNSIDVSLVKSYYKFCDFCNKQNKMKFKINSKKGYI
ncbi:unnamed protein product [Paramecium octaurelia]|uniref:Uncharacterized protein n=1 Tax=Paramecium octaurelia TaxID=43137 RepID=A0A8S1YQF1_PAROT|nr:unnamed protein product [Paramecium octaurelia]